MNRRIAVTLLTILALLWQVGASAAMGPIMVTAPVEKTAMPCHDIPGMSAMAGHSDSEPASQGLQKKMTCCDAGAHCVCTAACGTAALPMPPLQLTLAPQAEEFTVAAMATAAEAPPPHPFRPPIRLSV